MKRIALVMIAALSLTGCDDSQDDSQDAVSNSTYVCKDGVEYFVYERKDTAGRLAWNVVPHFHLDGSLYPCHEPIKRT